MRVFGGSFREVFWRVLTCFSDSFRTIFRTNFLSKRVNREWSYAGLRNHRISMIPGSEPILLDLEKLFLLSEEQISKEFAGPSAQGVSDNHQYFPSTHQPIDPSTHRFNSSSTHQLIDSSIQPINPSTHRFNPSTHRLNPSILEF